MEAGAEDNEGGVQRDTNLSARSEERDTEVEDDVDMKEELADFAEAVEAAGDNNDGDEERGLLGDKKSESNVNDERDDQDGDWRESFMESSWLIDEDEECAGEFRNW